MKGKDAETAKMKGQENPKAKRLNFINKFLVQVKNGRK